MCQSYALLSLFDDNDDEVTPLKSAVWCLDFATRIFIAIFKNEWSVR